MDRMAAAIITPVSGTDTRIPTKMIATIACGLLASHGMPPSVGPNPASVWLMRPFGSNANRNTIAITASDVAAGRMTIVRNRLFPRKRWLRISAQDVGEEGRDQHDA